MTKRVLLPQDLCPRKYTLELEPDLEAFLFKGTCTIDVDVKTSTDTFQLHCRELTFEEVTVVQGQTEYAARVDPVPDEKRAVFNLPSKLDVGPAQVVAKYTGILNDQMAGFYRSKYHDADGVQRLMASTQFEAIDARRAFPCWDEPAAKAVFAVSLTVSRELDVLANTQEKSVTSLPGGKKKVTFHDTPVMSTYLLAFCVGQFDFIQGKTKRGVRIRCYATPGVAHRGRFALDCACKVLDLYEQYFDIEYPLSKLDMIAIPEFAAGAMENMGLVTYREVDLLVDAKTASPQQRQRVCTVVTHELAHQWFGDLVTMRWWDDLWLNEGFACFMQTWSANHFFPEWRLWHQFINDELSAALRLDALRTSHPIQVPIGHAEEVEEVFDAISYDKGACVIRMLHAVTGEEAFCRGLRLYMQRFQYSNTETTDLWAALQETSGKPIKEMMASWTEQMGYPLVDVASEWDDNGVTLKLRQTWYLADGSEADADKQWTIPLSIGHSQQDKSDDTLMTAKEMTVRIDMSKPSPEDWVKLNIGQTSLMRVRYDGPMFERLVRAISNKAFSASDRSGVLNDYYALAKSGHVDAGAMFRVLAAFGGEDDATVWQGLAGVLMGLDKVLMEEETTHGFFARMADSMVSRAFQSVGWRPQPSDGHIDRIMRAVLVGLLARFSTEESVVAEARKMFAVAVTDPKNVDDCPSEFKSSIFSLVLRTAGAKGRETYEQMMEMYKKLDSDADRALVWRSIGFVPGVELKREVLDWARSGAVKLQDFFYPIGSVAGSCKEGQELTWQYFLEHFEDYKSMLKDANPSLMHAVIALSTRGFVSRERADEIEKFFKEHPVAGSERVVSQVVESIRINADFLGRIVDGGAAKPEFWSSF